MLTVLWPATELPLAVRAMRYGGAYILWQPFGTAQLLEVVANMVREWRSKPPENVPAGWSRRVRKISNRSNTRSRSLAIPA